ncbi:hypothetical protein ACFX2H_025239 [Malus domestica]
MGSARLSCGTGLSSLLQGSIGLGLQLQGDAFTVGLDLIVNCHSGCCHGGYCIATMVLFGGGAAPLVVALSLVDRGGPNP